jgi:hypothetical protein
MSSGSMQISSHREPVKKGVGKVDRPKPMR